MEWQKQLYAGWSNWKPVQINWYHAIHRGWRIEMTFRAAVLVALAVILCGCASVVCRFRATGRINEVVGRDSAAPPLDATVGAAIAPFGFDTSGAPPKNGTLFYSLDEHTLFKQNRIDIVLDTKQEQISIIDYNRSKESELVKSILAAIDARIASTYGASMEFVPSSKRVVDCLGP